MSAARGVGAVALGLVLAGWAWPRYGGRAVVEVPQPVATVDPALALDGADVLGVALTHKRLLVLDQDGNTLLPQLLVGLPTSGKDGQVFLLKLRPGLRFADGTALDATALKNCFLRLLSLRDSRAARVVTAGLQADALQVVDELSLQVTLDPPDPQFPLRLTAYAAAPRSTAGAGSGPFQPEPHLGPEVVLGVNLFDSDGRPFLDHVVLKPYRSRRDARVAAVQGDLDVRCAPERSPREGTPVLVDRALVLTAPESLPEREAWLRFLAAGAGLRSLAVTLEGTVITRHDQPGMPPGASQVALALDEGSSVARLLAQRLQLNAHAAGRQVLVRPMRASAVRALQESGEPVLALVEVLAPPRDPSLVAAMALPPEQAEALVLNVVREPGRAADLEEQAGAQVLARVPVRCTVPSAAPSDPETDGLFTASRRVLVDAVDGAGQVTLERAWWR